MWSCWSQAVLTWVPGLGSAGCWAEGFLLLVPPWWGVGWVLLGACLPVGGARPALAGVGANDPGKTSLPLRPPPVFLRRSDPPPLPPLQETLQDPQVGLAQALPWFQDT